MRQNRSLVWLALSGLLFAALPAPAEDFEFEVPVQLSKLDPAFTQGRVSCHVLGVGGRTAAGQNREAGTVSIGGGSTTFAIAQGSFDGSVSVKFNADRPQHEPADARDWFCVLSLVAPSGTEKLCTEDPTGRAKSKSVLPEFLKLDPKSVKGCAQGTIAPPK